MWHTVARLSDLSEGRGKIVECAGPVLALFKSGGKVYAIDNACSHRGGPLGESFLEGTRVICPWHAWAFDVKTGACETSPEMKQKTYPVKIQGEDILVNF